MSKSLGPVRVAQVSSYPDELPCPRCGESYLHHTGVVVYDRKEDNKQTIVTHVYQTGLTRTLEPSNKTNNPSDRRDGIALQFWCENCDGWPGDGPESPRIELTFAQHKGCTLMNWREIPRLED